MIRTIAARELWALLLSPLAWVILAVVQLILAFLFLGQLDIFISYQAELALLDAPPGVVEVIVMPLYNGAAVVLMMVVPLLTMRVVSEERSCGTLTLLRSAPITMTQIVLGKYLGVMGFLLLILVLLLLMPLSLSLLGPLDLSHLLAATLGLVLVVAAFAALGVLISCWSGYPAAAAAATFGLLLLLWLIDQAAVGAGGGAQLLHYLSLNHHFTTMLRGLITSSDLLFFGLLISTALLMTVRRLDAERLGG